MADVSLSQRESLLRWLRNSPMLRPIKMVMPNAMKRGIGQALGKGQSGTMDVGDGATLAYELSDHYWLSYASRPRSYEPEIWAVADRFMDKDTAFIDGGANIGLWSVVAGAKIKNPEQVIAIEPGDSILPWLRKNRTGNGDGFTILEAALWNKSGDMLTFHVSPDHSGSSLVKEGLEDKATHDITVPTVSVDDVADRIAKASPQVNRFIIKMDVEGVEQQALAGAKRTVAERNALLIYEDHGKEPDSEATDFFLKQGLHVYFVDDAGEVRRIESARALETIKTDTGKGYNFMACRPGSGFDRDFAQACGHTLVPDPVEQEAAAKGNVRAARPRESFTQRLGFGRKTSWER